MVIPDTVRTSKHRWSRAAISLILNHSGILLALAVAATVAAGLAATRLSLNSNLAALLPEDYDSVRTLTEIGEKVGGFETLQILLQGDDWAALKGYADALAPRIEASDQVLLVDYTKDVDFFADRALLYIDMADLKQVRSRLAERIEEEKLAVNPFFADIGFDEDEPDPETELSFDDLEEKYEVTDRRRYYTNDDQDILVLNIYPDGTNTNVAFARGFYRHVQELVADVDPAPYDAGIEVEYGGNLRNKIVEYEVIIDDVTSTAAIGITAVFLLLVLYFRQPMAVFFIGLPLAMGITWTFGLTELLIGELNTMTVFLFVVLFGIGIDFGIHLFARYVEERRRDRDVDEALEATLTSTGRALVTAALTSSAAFYSLTLADFKGFNEFGLIAGNGVLLSVLATLTVAPGLIRLTERAGLVRAPQKRAPAARGADMPLRPAVALFAAGLGLAVAGAVLLPRVQFQYDFSDLRAKIPEAEAVKAKLADIFTESNSPAVALAGDREALHELEQAVKAKIANDPTPTIDQFKSIYTALPDRQPAKLGVISDIQEQLEDPALENLEGEEADRVARLEELVHVTTVTIDQLPDEVHRVFQAKDGSTGMFGYIYPGVALKDGRNAIAFAEDVKRIEGDQGTVFHAANSSVVFADMLVMMLREGQRAVLLTFLAVFLFVAVDLRSLRGAVGVMTPLVVGILWLFVAMWATGMKLNFYNIVIIPSILGIGIDTGVHMYHRYRQEGPGSVLGVVKTTGGAVAMSSVTTMVGFSGLVVAYHPGLQAIGNLAVLGIFLTLVAALTFLPASLKLAEWGRGRRAG